MPGAPSIRCRRVSPPRRGGPVLPANIVCHGNSLSFLYPAQLATLRPLDTVNKRSNFSAFTDHLTAEFLAEIHTPYYVPGKRNLVVMLELLDSIHDDPVINTAVVNDANTTSNAVIALVDGYVAMAHSYSWEVLVGTVMDTTEYAATPAYKAARDATNAKLRVTPRGEGLVDFYACPELQDATNLTYWEADGLHVTAAGAAVQAARAHLDITNYLYATS